MRIRDKDFDMALDTTQPVAPQLALLETAKISAESAYGNEADAIAAFCDSQTAALTKAMSALATETQVSNGLQTQLTAANNKLAAQVSLYTVSVGQSINAAFKTLKVVSVQPGTYSEAVVVPAGCSLLLEGVTLDGKGTIPQPLVIGANAFVGAWTQFIVTGAAKTANATGAILVNGSNTIVRNGVAQYNGDTGIDVHGTQASPVNNVTLHQCKGLYNGRQGIKGGWVTNSLIDTCESGFNNTLKLSSGNEAGGGKWAQTIGLIFRNCNFHDNQGIGLWFDVQNVNYEVDGGSFTNHTDPQGGQNCSGIQIEISIGPGLIRNGTFSGNGAADVNVCESTGVSVTGCNMSSKGGGIWTRNLANRPPQLGPIVQSGNTFSNGANFFPPKAA
jgi:hypothetical protein